jgi:hypothetical protein
LTRLLLSETIFTQSFFLILSKSVNIFDILVTP